MRHVLIAAAAGAAIALITALAGLVPEPAAERCVIPGQARTTVVECEQR